MGEVGGGTGKNGGKAEKIGGEWGKVRHSPSPKYLRQQHSLLMHSMGPVVLFGGGGHTNQTQGHLLPPPPRFGVQTPSVTPNPKSEPNPHHSHQPNEILSVVITKWGGGHRYRDPLS